MVHRTRNVYYLQIRQKSLLYPYEKKVTVVKIKNTPQKPKSLTCKIYYANQQNRKN